jgi:large subunit ribosomal protein L3
VRPTTDDRPLAAILSEVENVAHILGRKVGMTRVFSKDGESIPVTVIEAGPCVVVQKKTKAKEGYDAIQVGFEEKAVKARRNNDGTRRRNCWPGKPVAGHFAKAGTSAFAYLKEFRVDNVDAYTVGQSITVADFFPGQHVDLIGTSKGKGFQGVMRRHNFRGGPETHGSMSHRAPGSIGSNADPSRTFPGMRMAGHMGDVKVTNRNIKVVEVDLENNIILVNGPVPGAKRALVMVQPTGFRGKGQGPLTAGKT